MSCVISRRMSRTLTVPCRSSEISSRSSTLRPWSSRSKNCSFQNSNHFILNLFLASGSDLVFWSSKYTVETSIEDITCFCVHWYIWTHIYQTYIQILTHITHNFTSKRAFTHHYMSQEQQGNQWQNKWSETQEGFSRWKKCAKGWGRARNPKTEGWKYTTARAGTLGYTIYTL